jgi:hypothetical protein
VKELHLMIKRMFKFSYAAALLFAGLASAPTPAAAGGCGYDGCAEPAPPPVVLYQSNCGCGGGSYYYAYAPANTYPSAYYGYAAAYGGYAGYGYAGYGYAGYGGYGYAGAAYRAAVSPYRYVNRFYRPRVIAGPRRAWVR